MSPAAWDHRQWRVAAAAYTSSVVSVAPAVPEFHSTSSHSWSDVFTFDTAHLQDRTFQAHTFGFRTRHPALTGLIFANRQRQFPKRVIPQKTIRRKCQK